MNDTHLIMREVPHTHYAQIPNIVDDMDLDPYAFRLYAHFRRVAGEDGACWQSTRTLAAKCQMSTGKVSMCKVYLVDAGLIEIEKRDGPHGQYDEIAIVDIWARNAEHAKRLQGEPKRSSDEPKRSQGEPKRSQGETKKIPLRRTPEEKPHDHAEKAAFPFKVEKTGSTHHTHELHLGRYQGQFTCPGCESNVSWPHTERGRRKMLECPSCGDQFIIHSQKAGSGKAYTYQPKLIRGPIGTYEVDIGGHSISTSEEELEQMKELVPYLLPAVEWAERKGLFREWLAGQTAARLISAAHSFSQRQEEDTEPYVAEDEEEDLSIWFQQDLD